MPATTPHENGFRRPAEWELHRACWSAFPYLDEWQSDLEPARAEFVGLCRAILDPDPSTGQPRGEAMEVLVMDERLEVEARRALGTLPVTLHRIPYGDIWLRDTGPIFLVDVQGQLATARFHFNGWGNKYVLQHDEEVASRVAERTGSRRFNFSWVLEGGSIEVDGEGTLLTTRQCLLHPSRNPGWDERTLEQRLHDALGTTRVLWLEEGLRNDHTDGHIDTLVRFVAPGVVVCMEPTGSEDPNRDVLNRIARDLATFRDAKGRRLEIVHIPSPGRVVDSRGHVMPASYCNFYIANTAVVVPTYGVGSDDTAVQALASLFPGRRTVGSAARHILAGGGAFHCITQEEPLAQAIAQ